MQLPIYRGNENIRSAVIIKIGDDRGTDCHSAQSNSPHYLTTVSAFLERIEVTITSTAEQLDLTIAIQIEGGKITHWCAASGGQLGQQRAAAFPSNARSKPSCCVVTSSIEPSPSRSASPALLAWVVSRVRP